MSEYYSHRAKASEERSKFYALSLEKIQKMQRIATRIIQYPEYKEAYDYVDAIFPYDGVKEVQIYKLSAAIFEKYGFGSAQGFYNTQTKNIFLSGKKRTPYWIPKELRIQGKMTDDEVIVHELCHYCYFEEGLYSASKGINEEFAYGWSLEYLRSKGYTDEEIIEYNYLPYLFESVYEDAYKRVIVENGMSLKEYHQMKSFEKKAFHKRCVRKIVDLAKDMAFDQGRKLVKIYSKLHAEGSPYVAEKDGSNRFDLLDI